MTNYIDLHVHSNCSDGTMSPTELVELAVKQGLKAFALTDHDTVSGIDEALAAAEGTGLEVIPGIEFSTTYQNGDVHVVALDMDYKDPVFLEALARFQETRHNRNLKMIEKLQEHGIDITYEKMIEQYPSCANVMTRAHFGRYLLENGFVSERQEAFDKYLADDACCFVPRPKITPFDVIKVIKAAGGIAVLAHPLLYKISDEERDALVGRCKEAGVDALEAMYSKNKDGDEERMRKLAEKYGILVSGGSDFHGANKPDIELGFGVKGNLAIPYEVWASLKAHRG